MTTYNDHSPKPTGIYLSVDDLNIILSKEWVGFGCYIESKESIYFHVNDFLVDLGFLAEIDEEATIDEDFEDFRNEYKLTEKGLLYSRKNDDLHPFYTLDWDEVLYPLLLERLKVYVNEPQSYEW